jgi:hypothetical protein
MWYEYNNFCEVYLECTDTSCYGIYGYVYEEWGCMDRSYNTSSRRFN